jgi:hypothetical protein
MKPALLVGFGYLLGLSVAASVGCVGRTLEPGSEDAGSGDLGPVVSRPGTDAEGAGPADSGPPPRDAGATRSSTDDGSNAPRDSAFPAPADASVLTDSGPWDSAPSEEGGVPTVGDAMGAEVFSVSQAQAARASCALPHGSALSPSTVGEKRALLVGSWLLCSVTGSPQYGVTSFSMAFSADGHWNNLLLDASGGLVTGYGVDNQGTYTIGNYPDAGDSQPLNGDYNVYLVSASGGSNGDPISFESSPRRMQILIGSTNVFEWYVPIGP